MNTGSGTFFLCASVLFLCAAGVRGASDETFNKLVAGMPPEEQLKAVMGKLKVLNPQFDCMEQHKVEAGAVTELSFSTAGVTDISPITALPWLRKLSAAPPKLDQKGTLIDLSPLAGMQLTWLWCHNNPIVDLSPLRGMPLTVLSISGTRVRDLTPLAGMKLQVLSFNSTLVSDLSVLSGMPLSVLWCNNTEVKDLSPLKSAPLRELKCDFVAERDAPALREIKTLARINEMSAQVFWARVGPIAVTNVPDKTAAAASMPKVGQAAQTRAPADAFAKEVASLPAEEQVARVMARLRQMNRSFDSTESHTIADGKVTEIRFSSNNGIIDLSPIRSLIHLQKLRFEPKQHDRVLSDFSPLRGLALVEFTCAVTTVRDLRPLAGMPLETLDITSSPFTDLTPLKGMPLKFLSIWNTSVGSLAPLAGMSLGWLNIGKTKVRDISPLRGMPLKTLYCEDSEVSDLSPLQGTPLQTLRCNPRVAKRNEKVLQSIPTLEKINGEPVAKFLERTKP